MATRLYTNNASTTLNGAIGTGDTTITLTSATGFPSPGAGEIAYATIDDDTNVEIITYTGVSTNDLTGVTRGVEGTSGTAFADGTVVEVRATAVSFTDVLQADLTPELQGPLDMSNTGVYASFGGSSTASAYSLNHSGGIPRLSGAANFHWTFTSSALYAQAGTTFNRIEFKNDSDRLKIYTNNSERLSVNDSGIQLGAANARVTTILDEDTMSSNSATALATQQSIKAYVDSVAGTGTAISSFRAYRNTAQALSAATHTKVQLTSESFDYDNTFDSTTNYRHTPTTAGKYLYIGLIFFANPNDQDQVVTEFYLNGSVATQSTTACSGTSGVVATVVDIIDMNGSTDYVELYARSTSAVNIASTAGPYYCQMEAIYIGA